METKLQKLDEKVKNFEITLLKGIFNIIFLIIIIYGIKVFLAKNELKEHKNEAFCFTVFPDTFLETIICTKKILKSWCF